MRRKGEQNFEYRVQKILEKAGLLLFNCARSKPFDLVAVEGQFYFVLELKGLRFKKVKGKVYIYEAPWKKEQKEMQIALAKKHDFPFFLIKQKKKKGKISVEPFNLKLTIPDTYLMARLEQIFGQWLVEDEKK